MENVSSNSSHSDTHSNTDLISSNSMKGLDSRSNERFQELFEYLSESHAFHF